MGKTVIENVLVFDGEVIDGPKTVVIDGALIGEGVEEDATVIDGTGCTLLPGLIDAHVHVSDEATLRKYGPYGITTVLDMGTFPKEVTRPLRSSPGMTAYYTTGAAAVCPGTVHARLFGFRPGGKDLLVKDKDEAVKHVENRVADGEDYIKIIADVPGFDQDTLNILVATAKEHGKLTVAHAARQASYDRALEAKVDILTHAPLDKPLEASQAKAMKDQGAVTVPTLVMMENMVKRLRRPGVDFAHSMASVTEMHKAGVPIIAGTDANSVPFLGLSHGDSMHRELSMLVQAGLTPIEALRAATSLPAHHFKLPDRGRIATGLRADLVLVEGNPAESIEDTKKIKRVWRGGIDLVPTEPQSLWTRLSAMFTTSWV
jgi:imidazolonepropionase-like amidohydrolase